MGENTISTNTVDTLHRRYIGEDAERIASLQAAPVNNIRYQLKNPCVETGLCQDCRSPQRICNMWSTIEGHMIKDRIHLKLIGEYLGY